MRAPSRRKALLHDVRAQRRRTLSTPANPHGPTQTSANPPTPSPSSRWLSDTKARIGRCIMFGVDSKHMGGGVGMCKILAKEWRELIAGRDGYLVADNRAGLLKQNVVWGEQDSMGHVNNVTYIRYAESARVEWARKYALHMDPGHKKQWSELWTSRGDGFILRSIKTDFKFPMTWPDKVSVFHKLSSLPSPTDSHFNLDVLIVSERRQRVAARCEEDIVIYDYKKGKKVPLRPFMIEAFKKTWEEQEKEKSRVMERISNIDGALKGWEKQTWDRSDAVEDMGGNAQ
ncbi:thioesterase-like superfamily-domain-containing protein [Amylocarpus encephaloides]|uniref:Thioesterase-like superfamily-domain-containing protein n=1 Tax=Amylocarpus encephaloides TaxID=45428 RepID=A0A9P7Y7C0_9HELO|nr:thioesterase-like superfamily-domain-containing protein [Amylocarpus encephaloides]